MEVFDIRVNLKAAHVNLFVVPFEIRSGSPTIGYLLVSNNEGLGSVFLDVNYQWATFETLPWDAEDLKLIGKEIASFHFLFRE